MNTEWGNHIEDEYNLSAVYDDESNYYNVKFVVSAKMANKIKHNYYKQHRKSYNIKGFRKGKIPKKYLEKVMGGPEAIYSMAFGIYATNKILEQCPYYVIHITDQEAEEQDNAWILSCKVMTEHPIDDIDSILDMNFDIPELNIDEYVKYRIETFKALNPYLHTKDDIVEEGDMVEVSTESYIDGEIYDAGCENAANIRVVEGAVQPLSLFEKLLGVKAGDNFNISTSNVKELSNRFGISVPGSEFLVSVKVNRVYTCEEPEIDDDLAISAGFNSLKEWTDYLTDTAERIKSSRVNQLKNQLVLEHISDRSSHPDFPMMWGYEKASESNNDSVSSEYVKNLCYTARQVTILKLIGTHLSIEWDDKDKNMYDRNNNAYALKVLSYLIDNVVRFNYVDAKSERDSEEDREHGT